jgi:ribonuclease J
LNYPSPSIPDGLVAIQTPLGTFIHSGDFKIDQTGGVSDINTLAAYGDRGVLALLSDSTNVEREGYTVPETRIGESLDQIMRKCEGRVMVAVFASNIYRIQQVVNSAVRYGRQVAFNGKSMITNCRIARNWAICTPGSGDHLGEMAHTPIPRWPLSRRAARPTHVLDPDRPG